MGIPPKTATGQMGATGASFYRAKSHLPMQASNDDYSDEELSPEKISSSAAMDEVYESRSNLKTREGRATRSAFKSTNEPKYISTNN